MVDYAAQSVFHTLVAALVVEALLRLWGVADPAVHVRFRLLPLAFPVAVLPAFLRAPVRGDEWFAEHRALFVGRRWGDLTVGTVRLDYAALGALATLGAVLFLMDAMPFVRSRFARAPRAARPVASPAAVAGAVRTLAGRLGTRPPALEVVDDAAALIMIRGAVHPTLTVSRGALERLDAREVRAALAHEVAHVARRDPLMGWVLMAARTVQFFNPVAQVVARSVTRDVEWRADALAVRATGDALSVASGLVKLFEGGAVASAPRSSPSRTVRWLVDRGRAQAIEARCRRLLDAHATRPVVLPRLRLGLTGVGLAALLFFVV